RRPANRGHGHGAPRVRARARRSPIRPIETRSGPLFCAAPVSARINVMATTTATTKTIRGRALIVWVPKRPGKKLDAIDTDQITPAEDCVSESLETLDERWKAGAFRHLMPDFRRRVHAGETFLIAGDRFAIGSSREMSPAGLKGIAEESRGEMVVVCGANMGDIFRRNPLSLGLHGVQSREGVEDARDGDQFEFDGESRVVRNLTQDKTYEPKPLTPKEEEIRQSGGIIAMGRREVARMRARAGAGGLLGGAR